MLVENSLVAVISLPSGVFNPYAGVKTSILILDKSLAKKTNTIAFFKINNDGFGLGAQRREIDKNDLPQAHAEIAEYLHRLRAGESVADLQPALGLIVEKVKVAANGEHNLSGERYREGVVSTTTYKLVSVGRFMKDGVKTIDPRNTPDEIFELWSIPAFDAGSPELLRGGEIGSQKKAVAPGDVLLSRIIPHIRRGWVVRENSAGRRQIASTEWIVFSSDEVVPGFLRQLLVSDFFHVSFMQTITGVGGSLSRANPAAVGEIQIPLPPIEVQKEIVAEIEGYQKVINGARAILDNYRPHIPIHPDWPMVELGEVCDVIQNGYPVEQIDEPGRCKVTRIQTIADGTVDLEKTKWTNDEVPEERLMRDGDILFSHINSVDHLAKTAIFQGSSVPVIHGINLIRFRFKRDLVDPSFALWSMKQDAFIEKARSFAQRAVNQASIKVSDIRNMAIALPPLETQQAIVAEIEAEQALVAANRELIARFEKKIQTTLTRVWGEKGDKYGE
ncbi:MAG: restriction endonuclease subunit S, partial [bacterium]